MVFRCILALTNPVDPSSIATIGFILAAVVAFFTVRRSTRTRAGKKKKAGVKAVPFVYPTHPVIEGPSGTLIPRAWPIDSIRHLVGPPPRTFDPELTSYLMVVPPKWMQANPNDEEWLNIKYQERVRSDGPVVWGAIVQANNNLYKRNNAESGASVIYSSDPWFDRNRDALGQIARLCFAIKGTDSPDPESASFARMLTNEMTRGMRMKVPSVFTGGRKVFHSSMLMPRKHLPKGFLSGRYFPVWIDPQNTGAVVMVPAAYWPASLTAEWDQ
ncbi:MAG: hypothetical protein ABSG31_13230 [Tepidisphaeraceae bacterium]|jgi:hypothetical protein